MKAFHGTTRQNAENILKGGCKTNPTWCVSDDEYLYLWCPDVFAEAGECDEEESEDYAIRMAFESGQITAAMSDEPQKEIVVLCFDFEEELLEDDDSCENMQLARRIESFDGMDKMHIKTLKAKHNSRLDALVISGLLENPNLASYRVSDDLLEAAKALKGVWVDSLLDFDWVED